MQLHPFFATITRPVYHDRAGHLFLAIDCPECDGHGEVDGLDRNICDPSARAVMVTCPVCDGHGRVYEQTCEDELYEFNSEEEKAAA